ncbi:serine/threonine-protein kinase [Cronbergia sp. UHCC 0137]|uniref:serine/threonine-protein kinase n=1 Tax=Cronbergia sp. UHCC 0137 TaxID=3110239 RepID=UPI002B202A65|nr:serine/threonine-protein kinase [Cronbergia sp. UHCC 0137]MEA5619069.1 serine/threonine-protein kinase [Cronbergia sp. UHCC 0137]
MGKKFGNRWEIIDSSGEGGQSWVYRVKDLSGEFTEVCILKRLKNPNRLDRFKQEIRAGKELKHERIPPILDTNLETEPYYFVTKYYEGNVLTKVAPLEPIKALTVFIDICNIVDYAHKKGIVHRDLKPDNIILDQDDNPIILDFGICYFIDIDENNRFTETKEQVGSLYYIAPELENGRTDQVTDAVDSYALGKILYFLLTGTIFARENYNDSNNLSTVCKNPQLDYVTQRILAKSVVEEPNQRLTVSELKEVAETVRRLIYEHFYSGKVGSRCRFCGEGTYQKIDCDFLKTSCYDQPIQSGTNRANDSSIPCEAIRCNLCGNIQFFFRTEPTPMYKYS